MKPALYLAWLTGLSLFVGLIAYQGLDDVAAAIAATGWGLVWITAFHLAPLVVDVAGWRALLSTSQPRSLIRMSWMRWICESVNSLLPVAQVGGDLVRARLLHHTGVPGPVAGATVIVDIMAGMLTLVIFAACGTGLLLLQFGAAQAALELAVGITVFGMVLMASYLGLRGGSLFKFARMFERLASGRQWEAIIGGAAALDREMTALCRERRAFTIACAWRLLGWLLGAGEVWLALYYLGHPIGVVDALILESLGQTIRAAAFVIPGALGVQETGFILLGGIVGVPAETALALSLIKRVRELALGIPGLCMWQAAEGYRNWHRQVRDA